MPYFPSTEVDCQGYAVAQLGTEKTALAAATVHLYLSSFTPTPQNVLADFTAAEADFDGYAASTIVWDAVGLDSNGIPSYQGSGPAFVATDGTTPNTIGGMFLATPGMTPTLVSYYPFTIPVNISTALAFIAYTITRTYPTPGNAVIQN